MTFSLILRCVSILFNLQVRALIQDIIQVLGNPIIGQRGHRSDWKHFWDL